MFGKSCCSTGCTGTALGLVRIGVGVFFTAFGMMKLIMMGPDMVAGMMGKLFGVDASLALIMAWVVIISELFGGILVLLGKLVPKILYQLSLLSFLVITIVGFVSAHWLSSGIGFDAKQLLWHFQLLLMITALLASSPKCPMGLTGDKE